MLDPASCRGGQLAARSGEQALDRWQTLPASAVYILAATQAASPMLFHAGPLVLGIKLTVFEQALVGGLVGSLQPFQCPAGLAEHRFF